MEFVQIVEFNTSRIDEMKDLGRKYEEAGGGGAGVMICRDRDNEGRYFIIASFDDYDTAMKNSEDPKTQELASKMQELADGPPTFYNLDLLERMG
ncbi:MAG: hypothetical protein LC792_04420 [Actinobacteria bacterium]|nr:hypothetical protein [Actinomycetota bacterium]